MPGYHEEDESDLKMDDFDVDIDDDDGIVEIESRTGSSRRPPHSKGNAKPSSSTALSHSDAVKKVSRLDTPSPKKKAHQTHTCPICNKTLETDNDGLNSHVDFCLSRGAIMQAQVEASKSTNTTQPAQYKGWPKPTSSKKTIGKPPSKTKGKSKK